MKNTNMHHFFFATASGVLFTLTAFVCDAAAQDSLVATPASTTTTTTTSTMNAGATPMSAVVEGVSGKARWRAGADAPWREVKTKDVIVAGTELRTGLRSNVTLKFANAMVFIDSNSNFALPAIEQGVDTYHTLAQLKSGRADFTVDKIGLANDFKVVTPTTTLAVKGTGFSVATGALTGTEVVGARTNVMAAIELKHAATGHTVQMSGGGGESKSSSSSPDPAKSALMATIGPPPSSGSVTSSAEREASAAMGTTQSVSQTQQTNTIAAVTAVTADIAAAASGDGTTSGNGNTLIALIADLTRVAQALERSGSGEVGASGALSQAIHALAAAQAAVNAAYVGQSRFLLAQQSTFELAARTAEHLHAANEALVATGEERSAALDNARMAFERFVDLDVTSTIPSGSEGPTGGGTTIEEFVAAAGTDAGQATLRAEDAASAAAAAGIALSSTNVAAENATASAATVASSASSATSASQSGVVAAMSAANFREIVDRARIEIAAILQRRPLPDIAQSLSAALINLESAVQSLAHAHESRDLALTAALEAHALAATTVLNAVHASALAASADALAAANAAQSADAAADDAQLGVSKLTLAIDAMLAARSEQQVAHANSLAASAAREIATAQTQLALVQVGAHQGALNVAQGAQFAAAGSLVEALNHLGLAILNGGFTSEQVQTCLERLEAGDLQAAEAAAASAADFARESDAQADETNIAAVATADHAGAAGAQIQISAGAANFYNDKSSTGWHAQVVSAQNDATLARSAAVGAAEASSTAALVAQLHGSAFALQFEGSAAASAALEGVARALALASQAAGDAAATALALEQIRSALEGAEHAGAGSDFTATQLAANGAAFDAASAQTAASDAREVADIAHAEAKSASAAVGSIGQAQQSQFAASVVEQHVATLSGIEGQVVGALAVQVGALAAVHASEAAAGSERAAAITQFSEAGARRESVMIALSETIEAMSQFDPAHAMLRAGDAVDHSTRSSAAAGEAHQASVRAADQDPLAIAAAALSHQQDLVVSAAGTVAAGILPVISEAAVFSGEQAVLSQQNAIESAGFASIAGTDVANDLSLLAAARSAEALARAVAAVDLSSAALARAEELRSQAQSAGFQEARFAAERTHMKVLGAQGAANDAQTIAASAHLHGQLAHASASAFGAGARADQSRAAGEIARDSARTEQFNAGSAIASHNAALANVTSLHDFAGLSRASAESTMNAAIGFREDTARYYGLAQAAASEAIPDYRATNGHAELADAMAAQSEGAAGLSLGHATTTRGYATQAFVQAGISQGAGTAYSNAVSSANGFAQASLGARNDTGNALAQAASFSQLATEFAGLIASAQATSAANFATAAHNHAIAQLSLAVQAQSDAFAAASAATSMGARVFFTRTAEIAGATAARASQAEAFANLARLASEAARVDANAALALVPPGWDGSQAPGP